jgi:hypothetical protein
MEKYEGLYPLVFSVTANHSLNYRAVHQGDYCAVKSFQAVITGVDTDSFVLYKSYIVLLTVK